MSTFKRNAGFTLIEVIIAVALVAIMAVAIAPPLVQNIKQGKITRAQSDLQAISTAILSFYKDVGDWPTTFPPAAVNRLVGNYSLGGGNTAFPRLECSHRRRPLANYGQAGTDEYLIRNQPRQRRALPVSRNPMSTRAERPYRRGHPTLGQPLLRQHSLRPGGLAGTATENFDMRNVIIVSAGPNKIFETAFDDNVFDEQAGGRPRLHHSARLPYWSKRLATSSFRPAPARRAQMDRAARRREAAPRRRRRGTTGRSSDETRARVAWETSSCGLSQPRASELLRERQTGESGGHPAAPAWSPEEIARILASQAGVPHVSLREWIQRRPSI
jgi:prepilin-type N-terminal cleavage/methylation domain-containing protein